ncbi:Ldh family oxidoreductase [Chloroflexota bacterium]
MADDLVKVKGALLKGFTKDVFIQVGMSAEDAETEANALIWANLHGVDSHGVLRIPWYVDNADRGVMNPKPNISILKETPATLLIEADRAFGPIVTVIAMNRAIEKAQNVGIGWVLIRNLTHQGALGFYSEMAAEKDMAGITFVCSPPNTAPYGAKAPGVHNSPISISIPAKHHNPLRLDMATSVVAGGKILLARDKGTAIPEGWALDKDGNPTTDPEKVTCYLPFGGFKGSGLAIMFECLSSVMAGNPLLGPVLSGGETKTKAEDEKAPADGVSRRYVGRGKQNSVVAAINISMFTEVETYKENIDTMIDGIKALPKADGVNEIFVPGEPEERTFIKRSQDGVPLPAGTIRNLQKISERFGLKLPAGL